LLATYSTVHIYYQHIKTLQNSTPYGNHLNGKRSPSSKQRSPQLSYLLLHIFCIDQLVRMKLLLGVLICRLLGPGPLTAVAQTSNLNENCYGDGPDAMTSVLPFLPPPLPAEVPQVCVQVADSSRCFYLLVPESVERTLSYRCRRDHAGSLSYIMSTPVLLTLFTSLLLGIHSLKP
jgi:hypothetical protein